jgi:hypothetical protein
MTTLIDLVPLVLELLDPPLEQDTSAMVAIAAVARIAPKRRDFFMTSSLLVVNARRQEPHAAVRVVIKIDSL